MNRQECLAEQIEWTCRNIAYNLDFVPDDKLNWKVSETADSPLGIANHVARSISGGLSNLRTGNWEMDGEPISSRDEIKEHIVKLGCEYAAELRKLPDSAFEGLKETPFGPMPNALISIPIYDAIHHHGQIAFLQTTWGDGEDHFFNAGSF
jgi:hypothetical protein